VATTAPPPASKLVHSPQSHLPEAAAVAQAVKKAAWKHRGLAAGMAAVEQHQPLGQPCGREEQAHLSERSLQATMRTTSDASPAVIQMQPL
jgi:hypothetical protein